MSDLKAVRTRKGVNSARQSKSKTATNTRGDLLPAVKKQSPEPFTICRVRFTPTALAFPESMNEEDWVKVGVTIKASLAAAQWWIGDFLVDAETRWVKAKREALLRGLGYARQSYYNMLAVSKAIPPERRRANLPWTYHESVASADADRQDELLAAAAPKSPGHHPSMNRAALRKSVAEGGKKKGGKLFKNEEAKKQRKSVTRAWRIGEINSAKKVIADLADRLPTGEKIDQCEQDNAEAWRNALQRVVGVCQRFVARLDKLAENRQPKTYRTIVKHLHDGVLADQVAGETPAEAR
jgi:hypothetical protein